MLEEHNRIQIRKKIWIFFILSTFCFASLAVRMGILMVIQGDYYEKKATDLHERERNIKASRGRIIDRTGVVLADNKTVCTISVIHNQIKEKEKVIQILSEELNLSEEFVKKRVEKVSSIEKIKSNVDKKTGDLIRSMGLEGVKVDEDYKRYYPYNNLGSKILGFTGADNQGIIGLEVIYDKYLQGSQGTILTVTDAKGIEIDKKGERRVEPIDGYDLHLTIDRNIQTYAMQLAEQTLEQKQAERVEIVVMNPQNGEILAMVDVPEFNLNDPYGIASSEIMDEIQGMNEAQKTEYYNKLWRNSCISDTYEPGSTFKIITASAGLESKTITTAFSYYCNGYTIVEDRKIRCANTKGHGSEDFTHCMMNSCNPALITVGLMMGVDLYYEYFEKFALLQKTGIDLPGEANTIMHKKENMGPVELATTAFGQSFQVSPLRMLTTVSSLINGGKLITPHLKAYISDENGNIIDFWKEPEEKRILSEETSKVVRGILEQVVSDGTGKNGKIEGYRIGGKTATSQTLPRGSGKYIASFIGFAPADSPRVIAIAIVHNPQGVYYGGQVAAPVVKKLFENIFPYLGIEEETNEE